MAVIALNTAATGLRALSTNLDVVANNLANTETTAFKSQRVNFEDLMYLNVKQPGVTSGTGDTSPTGIAVGLGVRVSNTQINLAPGSPENTSRNLDIAIEGSGFFRVAISPDVGDGTAFTRSGNFIVNDQGELVLNVGDGYRLLPNITIPAGVPEQNVSISRSGQVDVLLPGATEPTNIGQIQVTQFINPQGLRLLGGSLYQETAASGPPIEGDPQTNGAGALLMGFLESSNVDPVKELVTLIKTQRAFEYNSQTIQAADQALQTIGNLGRF